jgi:hypothetical protein
MAQQEIVPLHCWPIFTGAGDYGKPFDKPSTHLPAGMAALARSHGNSPDKPVWVQEFGVTRLELPEADVPRWMEAAVTEAISQGVSWITWWCSHEVDRRFDFDEVEYNIGLITVDNQIKESARMFKRLADAYRGRPVVIPQTALPAPPAIRTTESTWKWLLEWMDWKP